MSLLSESFFITNETTIEGAIKTINNAPIKICLVVDANGAVVRTLTDGDIRRALISGFNTSSLLKELPDKRPITLPLNATKDDISAAMKEYGVNAIVITDTNNRPISLVSEKDISDQILLSPPHIGNLEQIYIKEAFDDNWIAPAGPNLDKFEKALREKVNSPHCLAVSSGTAALHLALKVLNILPNDRVYVSDLTFAASLQPILYEHATPVLIDSDPKTWNMSFKTLERQLKWDAQKNLLPKAIIVAHIYGQLANMKKIIALGDKYEIPVIEDAAESLGATEGNQASGTFGRLGVFSFNGNKIITTSGGGALISADKELVEKAKYLATQGRDPYEHYQHSSISHNYRMSNVLAGIGLGQLNVLDERVQQRRRVFEKYKAEFSKLEGIKFQDDTKNTLGNRWLTVIKLDPNYIAYHPYQIMRKAKELGVEMRPAWKPMHMQPLCQNFEFSPFSADKVVSSELFLTSLCLPSGSMMKDSDIDRVVGIVTSIIRRKN